MRARIVEVQKKREDAPLFVAIDEPRCHSADVRTGANEQEDNQEE